MNRQNKIEVKANRVRDGVVFRDAETGSILGLLSDLIDAETVAELLANLPEAATPEDDPSQIELFPS